MKYHNKLADEASLNENGCPMQLQCASLRDLFHIETDFTITRTPSML